MDATRRTPILIFGLVAGVILSWLLVSNTFFGPQSRADQSSVLRTEAELKLKEGHREEALEKLKLALKLNPLDKDARRRYDELTAAGR